MNKSETKEALRRAVDYLINEGVIKSGKQITDDTGYGKSTVSLYINGDAKVSEAFIKKFEEVYKLRLVDFIRHETDVPGDTKEQINPPNMLHLTERLLKSYEDRIIDLKKNIDLIQSQNDQLRDSVKPSLEIVLDNQLTLTVLFESFLKSFAALMIEDENKQQEFRLQLHKDAFARLTDLRKRGNHLDIDKEDIVSQKT